MKKIISILLLSTSLLFLIGCNSNKNSKNDDINNSNEIADNDISKDDAPKKDTENTKKDNVSKDQVKNDNAPSNNSSSESTDKITITVFSPNANADGLDKKNVTINHLTAYSIINALADEKIVPSGTKALNFETKDNIGYLDVSSKIYNSNSGSSGEILMLDSIRETFLKAFNLQKIKLTVDGSPYTGSHIQYSSNDFL